MGAQCFGNCSKETNIRRRVRYEEGEVRCQICSYNKFTTEKKCYCCNILYRTKPRIGKGKKKLLANVTRY